MQCNYLEFRLSVLNTHGELLLVLVLTSLALILNIGYAHGDISTGIQGVRLESITSLPAPHSSTHIIIPFHPINSTSYSVAKSQSTTLQYAQKVVKPVLGPEPYISPRIVSVSPGGFDGIDASQSGGWTPPDVAMGAGPHHIVEMVNLAGQVYNKDGTPSTSLFSLSSFFGTGVDSLSDPRILYDSQSGRWFASILDITSSGVKIAVSGTNDPTGSWTIYNVPFSPSGTCPDQPRIGVSNDKFVVSANDFSNFCGVFGGTSSFIGADFFVFDKTELISGAVSLTKFQHFGPDLTKSAITPVQSLSSTNSEYMVSVDGALS